MRGEYSTIRCTVRDQNRIGLQIDEAEARFRLDAVKMYALLPLAGLRLKSKAAPSAVCDTAYQ